MVTSAVGSVKPQQTAQERALQRAKEQGIWASQIPSSNLTRWIVSSGSQAGLTYHVYLYGNGASQCDCQAGQVGVGCKHVALAKYERQRELDYRAWWAAYQASTAA